MRRCPLLLLALLLSTAAAAAPREILHHDLEVRIEPARAHLEVVDRVRFGPGEAGPVLDFLLHRDLEVAAVVLQGRSLDVESLARWRPRDFYESPDYAELGAWSIARQHRIAAPGGSWPGSEFEIEIHYAGAVYDSLHPPDVAYGRGFETTSGLIDPRGAYLSSETFWVPWTSDERFHFRLKTELEDGWHSMAQGRRAEHGRRGSANVTVWESEAPQELVYLVAGPYTIREREHRGVSLYTYTYADTPEDLCDTYLDAAARYLDRYSSAIAPYGFSKWAMVENWWQTGFGMPGFTLLGDRVIRLPFIVDTSYGHEILHCWWGNGVYVDYESGNWCEGLTAYGADYAYKLEQGEDAARDYRRNALTAYLDFASSATRDFPLREFRERSDFGTQAIGYGKCMMVFHMLEQRLGAETFGEGLREFYRRFEFRPASWDDIAAVFGEVSGTDLGGWFSQWIDRAGAARIEIASLDSDDDGWVLRLRQADPPYQLRVPVVWADDAGEHLAPVPMDGTDAEIRLPPTLLNVAVDPGYDLFREVFREEIPAALSQVLGADSTLVVIGARGDARMKEALRSVAADWARNQPMQIVEESELGPGMGDGRARFLLGDGPAVDATFEKAASTLGEAPARLREEAAGKTLVACFRDPDDPELATAVVLPQSVGVVEAIGRKIPHYSRYSWLRFDGEENVGKGSWTVLSSPLRRTLEVER